VQDFIDKYPLAFLPLFILFWCAVTYLIALLTGWSRLAERFRLSTTFTGPTWNFQTARMRFTARYGNCLTVGADPTGLEISILFLFRPAHPPLFIPWSEITLARRSTFLGIRQVKLLLGHDEQIPFTITGRLADRLQSAAGASWPAEPAS
jgi:hypothetical protein